MSLWDEKNGLRDEKNSHTAIMSGALCSYAQVLWCIRLVVLRFRCFLGGRSTIRPVKEVAKLLTFSYSASGRQFYGVYVPT